MTYELFNQGPAAYIPIILVSLLITLVAYGAFPLVFARMRKKTITKKKYNLFCYCVNFLVMVLFVAVNVLSDFGNPLIVAGRFRVLAVEIYTQLTGWLNAGSSAVLGIVLIVPSVILFTVQNRLLKKNMPKISGIGGKNAFAGQGITKLSGGTGLYDYSDKAKVSDVLIFLLVLFISGCVLAQFVAIIAGSFQKIWGVNTAFTVQHFSAVKRYSRSLFNSVFFIL